MKHIFKAFIGEQETLGPRGTSYKYSNNSIVQMTTCFFCYLLSSFYCVAHRSKCHVNCDNAGRCYLLNLWQIFAFQVIIVTGERAQVKCATLSCGIERGWHWFIMIFLRLAGFFQQFLKYVCPEFSAPLSAPACAYLHLSACNAQAGADRYTAQAGGFRSGVLRLCPKQISRNFSITSGNAKI